MTVCHNKEERERAGTRESVTSVRRELARVTVPHVQERERELAQSAASAVLRERHQYRERESDA